MAESCTFPISVPYTPPSLSNVWMGSMGEADYYVASLCELGKVKISRTGLMKEVRISGKLVDVVHVVDFDLMMKTDAIYINFCEIDSAQNEFCSETVHLTGFITVHESETARLEAIEKSSDDFSSLLQNPDSFSDVHFKCGDDLIPAHKNILAVRSPVFAAMFRNNMRENVSGIICIEDIDLTVFQHVIHHIYSGKIDMVTGSLVEGLLFASDKYDLGDLKEACCQYLRSMLSQENALQILDLGDMFDEDLKGDVMSFICTKIDFCALQSTEEWQSLMSRKQHLYLELEETKKISPVWNPQSTLTIPTDIEALKLMQTQLSYLFHARKCQQKENQANRKKFNCYYADCSKIRWLSRHMASCREGPSCRQTHCDTSKRLLYHWENCTQKDDCSLCITFMTTF